MSKDVFMKKRKIFGFTRICSENLSNINVLVEIRPKC